MKRTSTKVWQKCSRISLRARKKVKHKLSTQSRAWSVVSESQKGGIMKLQQTTGNRLLSLLIALAFALTMYPTKAKAQITGDLEVDVPFPFHAGNRNGTSTSRSPVICAFARSEEHTSE